MKTRMHFIKKIFLSFFVLLFIQIIVTEQVSSQNTSKPISKTETVDFCNLINNPNSYENKIIRTLTIYAFGGEDFTVLYSPQCYTKGVIKPNFTNEFEVQTKKKFINKISRQKHSSGTVRVMLIGVFSSGQLQIDYFEKADFISKESHFPDRLSPKTKKKLNCCAKS